MSIALLSCESSGRSNQIASSAARRNEQGAWLSCSERVPSDELQFAYHKPIQLTRKQLSDGGVGFVVLGFDVSDQGRPENVHVVRASLGHDFDEAAVVAFRQRIFCPREFGKKDQTFRMEIKSGCSAGHNVGCR